MARVTAIGALALGSLSALLLPLPMALLLMGVFVILGQRLVPEYFERFFFNKWFEIQEETARKLAPKFGGESGLAEVKKQRAYMELAVSKFYAWPRKV